jgi:hypothetical protein
VKAPERIALADHYMAQNIPAVITDLFAEQSLSRLVTAGSASTALGDLPLDVRMPYHTRDGQADDVRRMSLRAYFEHVEAEPHTEWLCVEQPTPPEVRRLFAPPGYCDIGAGGGDTWESRLFVGNAGNASNLHFDADFRAVLLHQVFGVKRIVWVAPWHSPKLLPFMNLSRYRLARFIPGDRDEFLAYVHAFETLLMPGETAFIPAGWWHHVDYLELSFSINVRLRRNALLRLIGGRGFHKTWRLGCIAASAPHPEQLTDDDEHLLSEFREALSSGTPSEKLAKVEQLIGESCDRRFPQLARVDYADIEDAMSEAAMWRRLLSEGVLYAE